MHREVDIDVRHRLPTRIQEALEQQVVLERVDVGDLEAVGDERAGRRSTPGPDADPVVLREGDEVPDDEEVVREAHLTDGLQLEGETLFQLRCHALVAPADTLVAELDEVLEGITPVRGGERGEQDPPELHADRAPVRDLERSCHRLGKVTERRLHLLRRLEVELVGVELPVIRVRQRVARLDAEERLVRARVLVPQVVDVARGDERYAARLRECDKLGIDLLLDRQARVLKLDVDRVATEDVTEPRELGFRILRLALLESPGDAP